MSCNKQHSYMSLSCIIAAIESLARMKTHTIYKSYVCVF